MRILTTAHFRVNPPYKTPSGERDNNTNSDKCTIFDNAHNMVMLILFRMRVILIIYTLIEYLRIKYLQIYHNNIEIIISFITLHKKYQPNRSTIVYRLKNNFKTKNIIITLRYI